MKITFYAPFRYVIGIKEFELQIAEETVSVKKVLEALTARWSVLKKYFGNLENTEEANSRLTLIVDGERKELKDIIKSNASVKILGPISGG